MTHPSAPMTPTAAERPVLPPHPVIPGAYQDSDGKKRYLNAIFDETAQDYDRIERWLSLGTGRWYRRKALQRAGLKAGMQVLDVATGTGLVAGEALALIGSGGRLIGADPSREMMRRATERLAIETVAAGAESLPFDDASFDFVSMGYALRHVQDLNSAFREFHRVLKPAGQFGAGRVCLLEVTRPRSRIFRILLRLHITILSRLMGSLCRMEPRTPELWAYYWKTIEACVPPDRVTQALRDAGFTDVRHNVVAGIFSEYTAART